LSAPAQVARFTCWVNGRGYVCIFQHPRVIQRLRYLVGHIPQFAYERPTDYPSSGDIPEL